eukprot:m.211254 g.211254  ORF g.211254 m.211254 type:complete len:1324 (+) comp15833_c0_seq4:23-3994(+)
MATTSAGGLAQACPSCKTRITVRQEAVKAGVYKAECPSCYYPLEVRLLPTSSVTIPTTTAGASSALSFTLNGVPVNIDNPDPKMSLNEYIREVALLTGTKRSCQEGGCGACVVMMTPPGGSPVAVNSCLKPVCSVQGAQITTIEGIGSTRSSLHPIQAKLIATDGSQCGYCTPGVVMSMYSLLAANKNPTQQQVEHVLDGNICRCTGYRPILDAFQTFSQTSPSKAAKPVLRQSRASHVDLVRSSVNGTMWITPSTLEELFSTLQAHSKDIVRVVVGNTSTGIYKHNVADVLVDISKISDLTATATNASGVTVGAAVTIANLIETLLSSATSSPAFAVLASHLKLIANVPVRNAGSWAGNLMLTHDNPNFPSDIFTIMSSVGATLTVGAATSGGDYNQTTYSLWDFLQLDMTEKIIINMTIPFTTAPTNSEQHLQTYKIMPRHVNAHAYVNTGINLSIDKSSGVIRDIAIVYGGIADRAIQATQTAKMLTGKNLVDKGVLGDALRSLAAELRPNNHPVSASPAYRSALAVNLLFKACVNVMPQAKVDPRILSSLQPFARPISEGVVDFQINSQDAPVGLPISKKTADLQTTGEAKYIGDVSRGQGTLHMAFAVVETANAIISSIDISSAKVAPGVNNIFLKSDLPAGNQFYPSMIGDTGVLLLGEGDRTQFSGQAVAIVVASTQRLADDAAFLVNCEYSDQQPVILDIQSAIDAGSFFDNAPPPVQMGEDIKVALANSHTKLSGQVSCGSQYHFHMETQTCHVEPTEDGGLNVFSSTQSPDFTQREVSETTGLPANKIRVINPRSGGAYGGKISNSLPVAAACSIASRIANRPISCVLDINTNMKMMGKRHPFLCNYTIGCDADGKLQAVQLDYFANGGAYSTDTDGVMGMALTACDGAYFCPNWLVTPKLCKTNTPSNTWTRAPGCAPAIFIMESIMENIACTTGQDPEDVRQINMYSQGQKTPYGQTLQYCNLPTLWQQHMSTIDYAKMKSSVDDYNKANRFRKRGISIAPNKYGLSYGSMNFSALVTVCAHDGTVIVSHGGAESGQGINTKVAQVAARELGVDFTMVRIEQLDSLVNANQAPTGGSVTSEICCQAVINACGIISNRMQPVKSSTKGTWAQIVQHCFQQGIDMSARAWVNNSVQTSEPFHYNSYGILATEVEIDLLTGETSVLSTSMLFDCGDSLNPSIDIGQIEGALTMSMGYWLTEEIKHDPNTGLLLTDGTWEYKPPSVLDIPISMNTKLLANAPNPLGVLRSKATGEPPFCMGCNVISALRYAIKAARVEMQDTSSDFIVIDGPATCEKIQQLCKVTIDQLTQVTRK